MPAIVVSKGGGENGSKGARRSTLPQILKYCLRLDEKTIFLVLEICEETRKLMDR